MNNTLAIFYREDGRVQTDITTSDGVSCMEIHRLYVYDSKVLNKLRDRNFYQNFKGNWYINFPTDQKVIQANTFVEAINKAQEYIFDRDNPEYDYGHIC